MVHVPNHGGNMKVLVAGQASVIKRPMLPHNFAQGTQPDKYYSCPLTFKHQSAHM